MDSRRTVSGVRSRLKRLREANILAALRARPEAAYTRKATIAAIVGDDRITAELAARMS